MVVTVEDWFGALAQLGELINSQGGGGRDGRREKKMGRDVCLGWRLKVSFLPLVGSPLVP